MPGRYIAHLVSAKRLDALRVQRVALVTYDGHLWQAAPAEGQDVFTTGLDVAPAGGLGRPQAGLALLPLLVENQRQPGLWGVLWSKTKVRNAA